MYTIALRINEIINYKMLVLITIVKTENRAACNKMFSGNRD